MSNWLIVLKNLAILQKIKEIFIHVMLWLRSLNQRVDEIQEDINEAVDSVQEELKKGEEAIYRGTKEEE